MIGKKLLAIAVTYLLLRYIRNVYRIFQVLKKRRALIQTFAGREYIPDEKIVSKEEFEEGLKSLEQMVPDKQVGMMSMGGDIVFKVFAESAPFVAGGTAAILQSAHPYVSKGVFEHSEVLKNPLSRFQKTFLYVFRITYGDLETTLKSARVVRAIHDRVHGEFNSAVGHFRVGGTYTAHNQEALKWVHSTLLETQMFIYELIVQPLTLAEKEQLYKYYRNAGIPFGVSPSSLPQNYQSFMEYYFTVCNSTLLTITPEAKIIADAILKPLLWEKFLPFNTLKIVTSALLPSPISSQYQYPQTLSRDLYTAAFLALFQSIYLSLPGKIRHLTGFLQAQARGKDQDISWFSKKIAVFAENFVVLALATPGPEK